MCGITGIWFPDRRPIPTGCLERMNARIAHRGPDDEGCFVEPGIGLAVRRLAIIDLAGGHQPMSTWDDQCWIVFNGEIFNYRELRAELEGLGHRFKTRTDTEVCLHSYQQWGMDAWRRFAGMFGVAIWDSRQRRLLLARDPLGIKPVYYVDLNPGLAFGSELKCLFELPGAVGDPDPEALDEYLAFGHVFAPNTFYTRARKLLPGHVLLAEEGRPLRVERYWSLRIGEREARSHEQWEEGFREIFETTVKRHLVSDVPLGIFLSGGVDSSAVAAATRRVHQGTVRTFSIGFRDQSHNELPHARRVAEFLNTDHTAEVVELASAETLLPLIARQFDEPFADSSAVPTWYVSQVTRAHVKVALSGDGGDELFAGYPRHLNERWMTDWQRLPAPLRSLARGLVALVPRTKSGMAIWRQRTLKRLGDAELPGTFERFFSKCQIAEPSVRRLLYQPEYSRHIESESELLRYVARQALSPVSNDPVENMLYADTVVLLPDDMLTKVDRASMAHSLEVRVPFLDHTLVDYVAAMPVSLKLSGTTSKYLLKKVIRPWLPEGILDRRKQGFTVPLSSWFRGPLGKLTIEWLEGSGVMAWDTLRPDGIRRVVAEHEQGRADHSALLYALLMLAAWRDGPDAIRRENGNRERVEDPPSASLVASDPAHPRKQVSSVSPTGRGV